jgi:hypothetical protein
MLWPCSAAAANVLSNILAVAVCCGPSMADESSSYIEIGPFSNFRRMGRGAERLAEIAAEFVRLKVDVIVTGGNAAVAAKQASSVVPIVFALVDDPVGMGLIASLARPGGNVTGLSMQQTDLAGKRLGDRRSRFGPRRQSGNRGDWRPTRAYLHHEGSISTYGPRAN